MPTVSGHAAIVLNDSNSTVVDLSFVPLSFQTVNGVQSQILNIEYNILRPNYHVDIIADSFISLNNTLHGANGTLQVNLLTGNEKVSLNGNMTATIPVTPGNHTITYNTVNGILTWV